MASDPAAQTILRISQIYTLVVYFIILVGGLIGNVYNIAIFSWLKVFRHNQCAFYLMTVAIVDFVLIILVIPLRIGELAFNYDPTRLSLVWCKIRHAMVGAFSLMSFASVCFAAVDQYLSTHHVPWIRQLGNYQLARRLVIGAIICVALHSIPFFIFFEIGPTSGCSVYNVQYARYFSFVHFCTLSGVLPITVSVFFAIMAYLNVRRIVRRQIPLVRRKLDKQLTAMILTKVAFLAVTTSPFVIFRIYQLNRPAINPNNLIQIAVEQLLYSITASLFYVNSSVSDTALQNAQLFCVVLFQGTFFVFLCVSKRFRQQARHVIVKNLCRMLRGNSRDSNTAQNQVAPTSQPTDSDLG